MAVQLSPGVNVTEIDLTTVVPAVSSTDAGFAGLFRWGPVGELSLITSITELEKRYGKPTNFNAETFFTAYNFLTYANRLWVSRSANTTGTTPNVSVTTTSGSPNVTMTNTSALTSGMFVYQSGNTSAIGTGNSVYIVSVTNSTSIVLSTNAAASNTFQLYFANPETSFNALAVETSGIVANQVNQIVRNRKEYSARVTDGLASGNFDTDVLYIAKFPGDLGNSLRVAVCDTANSFTSVVNAAVSLAFSTGSNTATMQFSGTSNAAANTFAGAFSVGDQILAGNTLIGFQYLQLRGVSVNTNFSSNTLVTLQFEDPYRLASAYSSNSIARYWEFRNVVDGAPGQSTWVSSRGNTSANDELHVVVIDDGGKFTGTPGTILEVYKNLSRASDAKSNDNSALYYKDVINQQSNYIWWANDRSTAVSNTALYVASASSTVPGNYQMILGADGLDESSTSLATITAGYDLFKSPEDIDVSLILQGKPIGAAASEYQLANWLIQNIAEQRKDCIVLVSPKRSTVLNNSGNETADLVAFRNNIQSTSYAVLDSGYKYQYDRYNDIYRWVPMNGDIAGLCVRTDDTNDAWWSPAGFNRGAIKNVVKLAFNPNKSQRDVLFSNGINPVVTFPGQGTVLYGDKTLLSKPSAFDRINVRRLFIVLEKAISRSAKFSLFEFNDAFTRAQFKNLIVPYLRTIQGRRGITDFYVVCDETNNTPQIIDSNQFVGDIYIKPARSINFIQLNFVAVGTGVQFSQVVGRF